MRVRARIRFNHHSGAIAKGAKLDLPADEAQTLIDSGKVKRLPDLKPKAPRAAAKPRAKRTAPPPTPAPDATKPVSEAPSA